MCGSTIQFNTLNDVNRMHSSQGTRARAVKWGDIGAREAGAICCLHWRGAVTCASCLPVGERSLQPKVSFLCKRHRDSVAPCLVHRNLHQNPTVLDTTPAG